MLLPGGSLVVFFLIFTGSQGLKSNVFSATQTSYANIARDLLKTYTRYAQEEHLVTKRQSIRIEDLIQCVVHLNTSVTTYNTMQCDLAMVTNNVSQIGPNEIPEEQLNILNNGYEQVVG